MKTILKSLLLISFLAMSVCSLAQNGSLPPTSPKDLKDGQKAPDVTLKDSLSQDISIASFLGKYVLIDVWHSRCSPCLKQIPFLKDLEEKMKGENIVFLSINCDSQEFRWRGMRDMYPGLPLWDQNGSFCEKYNAIYSPRFILIDPEGRIEKAFMPQPSKPEALAYLKELFTKK